MKKTKQKILSVCLALGMLIQCAVPSFAAENTGTAASPKAAAEETWSEEGRNRVDFCDGWKFQFGDSSEAPGQERFDDSSWETVNVPHTWNNLDAQDGGSDYKRGAGWYRKEFQWKSEYEGKRIFIEFQGSALETTVYVNGEKQGTPHKGGYTAFRYDITDSLKKGTNVIAVKSDNTWTESIIPLSGDFSVFGGIYREVSLVVTDFVHVDLEDHGSGGLYLQTENVSDASAGLTVRSTIVNDSDQAQEVTVTAVLKKPDSFEEIEEIPEPIFNVEDMVAAPGEGPVATLTETFVLKAGEEREFSEETVVSNPHLWNGLEDPFRYQVDLTVEVDGKVVDEVSDYVGFRYFRVDKNTGFYLNGKKYPLRGVSRHQDRQDMGSAITTAEHNEDFGMIYEIGANSVRLSHYPQASYFYDLCDRYGIVVWAEIPFVDQVGTASDFYEVTENQLVEMIRQQYNRPSICFWGLQNEVGNGGKNTTGMAGIMTKLNNKAHEEDPSRLTTQATNGNSSWDSDLIAWNTYPGWYGGTASGLGTTMDSHKSHKNPIAISEYGAGGNVLHHEIPASQPTTTGPWHPEEYQTLVHEEAIKAISTRDYLWATYVWNMFEFASDWRAEGEVPGINDKGLVTYDRKTKKDSFYLYKANWNKHDIFTYVASRRYTPREDDVIPSQKVYSNCDSVELRVNGVSLGEMNNLGYGIFELENVSLKAGENVIEAVGTKGGKTYIDTVTIERTKGSQAKLTSDELYVDNEAKTIGLTRNVTAQELPQILRGITGATWKLTEEDGTTPVTSGIIVPGMKVHVTAEDESEEAVYVFTAIHISANKPVTVSSAESANPGANAVDFDDSTRWAANTSGGDQWIYVDLQDEYYLNQICVDWYNNSSSLRSYQYRIEVSSDAQNWTTAIDRTNNTQQGRVTDGFISGTKGRYVRIYVTGCDKGNASIYEIIINGWSLESSAYDIDHENRIINVPTPENGEFIWLDSFLANLEIKGDCTSTLDASSYFMTNGDKLILSDSAGNQVVYVVDLADGIPIEDTVISVRKPVLFSAEEGTSSSGEDTHAANVNDGKTDTRWSAPQYDADGNQVSSGTVKYPEWVVIDLQKVCDVSQVEVLFYKNSDRYYQYDIWLSQDGTEDADFTKAVDCTDNQEMAESFSHEMPDGTKARYVKIRVTGCSDTARWAGASIYEVTVKGRYPRTEIALTGIRLSPEYLAMDVGETREVSCSFLPEDATRKAVVWESSDPSVVTAENGRLAAIAPGTAKVRAVGAFDKSIASGWITVKVRENEAVSVQKPIKYSAAEGLSSTGENTAAKNINDGDLSSRWSAPQYDSSGQQTTNGTVKYPEWVIIDLQSIYDISDLSLLFYKSGERAYQYEILVSTEGTDAASFQTVIDKKDNAEQIGPFDFELPEGTRARYVKINVTGCDDTAKWAGASVYEMTVYGKEVSEESNDEEILNAEKEHVEQILENIGVANDTTAEEILAAVVERLNNKNITAEWSRFTKTEATIEREGSVEGELLLKLGNAALSLEFSRTIEKLLPPTQDKEVLKTEISKYDDINLDEYADGEAKESFQQALTDAREILLDENATQEQIEDAVKLLSEKFSKLEKVQVQPPTENEDGSGENNGSGGNSNNGNSNGDNGGNTGVGGSGVQIPKQATVRLNATTIPLAVKQKTSAVKIAESSEAGDKIQSASSSNKKIVKVSVKKGVLFITGKKKGKAVVTVTTASGASAKVTVKVQKAKVKLKKLKLDKKKYTLKKGKSLTLIANRTPITSVEKLSWSSSNKKVATVNSKGVVKARNKGKAVITVRTAKGKKAKCSIMVK